MKTLKKITSRQKRIMSIKKTLFGSSERPRITVFRSNKFIYAQIVDDVNHKTIAEANDSKIDGKKKPIERAAEVGKKLAEMAKKSKVEKVVFDRRGYKYHGRVKALAEAAREAGRVF